MRIALYVGSMSMGGVTTFILELGPILQKAGHDVCVVARAPGELWERLQVRGVLLPFQRPNTPARAVRQAAAHFNREKYDLVMINNGIGADTASKGLHTWPEATSVVMALHNDRQRVYTVAGINSRCWNVAVGVSSKVCQTASARLPDRPVVRIPYGIHLPDATQIANRQPWQQPLRLLYVGGLYEREKGIFRLPAILKMCRARGLPVHLTVIGKGPDREALERLFASLQVNDLVKLSGAQSSTQVYQAMQNHHVLLMPSNFEGLPLVSLEAQANGCVPVASLLPGITDDGILDQVSGYLVEKDAVDQYVNRIESLLNPDVWQKLSRAGIARARQEFSLQTAGERYLALFERVRAGAYPLPAPCPGSPLRVKWNLPWSDYLPYRFQPLVEAWKMRLTENFTTQSTGDSK